MKTLSATQVKDALDRKEELRLINVLPEDHFRKKRIPGSLNIPVGEDAFLRKIEEAVPRRDARVVVYCSDADCDASPKAAEKLEKAGFVNVADFEGGVKAWEQAGLPLEGESVAS